MIFVFGSNLRGIHGAGAARQAFQQYGAAWGVGEGLTAYAYALPTKHTPQQAMTIEEIRAKVITFLRFAANHPRLEFKITQIGCGLGGWSKEDIAPLFTTGPGPTQNCYFDTNWRKLLPNDVGFWGSF